MLIKKTLIGKIAKTLTAMLVSAIVISGNPALSVAENVHADDWSKYKNSWIETYGLNDTYGLVYFGTYKGSPVKYRIYSMHPEEVYTGLWTFEAKSGEEMILLDCDTTLENMQYHSAINANYSDSTLNNWLNGTYLNSLTDVERDSIVEVKHTPYQPAGDPIYQEGFTYRKIFILSSEEAQSGRYRSSSKRKKEKTWWVRTHNYNDGNPQKGYVLASGAGVGYAEATNSTIGVSPAFCLNKDSILFSSRTPELDVSKVTLADKNIRLTVNAGDVYKNSDGKIAVSYSLSGSDAAKVTSIAAYFRLNDESDTTYKKCMATAS